jgi:Nucleotidyl transferase AbiEii toxin, Type IV TA system
LRHSAAARRKVCWPCLPKIGFSGERDLANPELSSTKRKPRDRELRAAITDTVKSTILPKLQTNFEAVLGKQKWDLIASEERDEEMTLFFRHPNAFEHSKYLHPQIKIEFGRGDQQPYEKSSITPFVAEKFPDIFQEPKAFPAVLDCQRTFWEKVTLLHAENHRSRPEQAQTANGAPLVGYCGNERR